MQVLAKGELFSLGLILLRFFFVWKGNQMFCFGLTEINMEVEAAGQRELCYERQTQGKVSTYVTEN